MRQHETLRDIMDAMGLYDTAWGTDTIGDIVRQYETLRGTMRHHEISWQIMRQHDTVRHIMDEMGWTV